MQLPSARHSLRFAVARQWKALAFVSGAAWLTGCTPSIGDSCALSTDCATDGTRVCDTSEPGGYCTVLNCTGNELGSLCPDNAICVEFFPNLQGCPVSVRSTSRVAIAECRNICTSDSDCRTDYYCRSPQSPPWSGELLDPNQTALVCLPLLVFIDGGTSPVNYGYDGSADAVPPVCQAMGPSFDAGFPPLDAPVDAPADAPADASDAAADASDAAADARADGPKKLDGGARDGGASDAKVDSTLDAGHHDSAADAAVDGPRDGSHDGPRDGGTLDAPDGHTSDAGAKDGASDAPDAG
jgi:hypothetical protein